MELLAADQPQAIIVSSRIPENSEGVLESMEETKDLPQYDYWWCEHTAPAYYCLIVPTMRKKGERRREFDEVGYNDAMEEYKADVEGFELLKEVAAPSAGTLGAVGRQLCNRSVRPWIKPKANGQINR